MASSSVPVPAVTEPRSLERSSTPVDRQKRDRHRARMRLLRRGIWALVLAAAVAATALALRPQPVPVDVARVELGPLEVAIEESGHTRVKDRYVVSALVTGQLSRIWLESGDPVSAGDTLAEIAPSIAPLIDERSQAEAEAKVGAAVSSVGQARKRWARAVTGSELADRELARARALAASGARTSQELEGAEFAARMQKDDVASAEFAVDVAEEEVRLARAALGGQREPRGDRHVDVLAPVSGRVLRVLQQSAGLVQAGAALVEVGDPAALEGVVDLLTTDAVQVRPGMPVSIVGWGGDRGVNARVKRVEPSGFTRLSALGVEEQRVNVVVVFTDPGEAASALGDGYHIEARFVLWQNPSVVKVPLLAVFRHGGGSATFKLEGNVARLTPITLGHRGALDVEVVNGLTAGDVVVVHPGDRVDDGVKVAVL